MEHGFVWDCLGTLDHFLFACGGVAADGLAAGTSPVFVFVLTLMGRGRRRFRMCVSVRRSCVGVACVVEINCGSANSRVRVRFARVLGRQEERLGDHSNL